MTTKQKIKSKSKSKSAKVEAKANGGGFIPRFKPKNCVCPRCKGNNVEKVSKYVAASQNVTIFRFRCLNEGCNGQIGVVKEPNK